MTTHVHDTAPNAHAFEPLSPEKAEAMKMFQPGRPGFFPALVGLSVEEIRHDYARMRMAYRPELNQPAGVVHGGAIASLIDTVVVPALMSGYDVPHRLLTIDLQVQYIGAVIEEDAVAEGWIVKRGRSTVFCRAEVRTVKSGLVAAGTLVYKVSKA